VPELDSDRVLGDAFWGVLFGLIFFSPLVDAAVESPAGDVTGGLAALGIDDTFVNRVRDSVTPGTSGLFVLGEDGVVDRVGDALRDDHPLKMMDTRLSRAQESSLREVFAG
jgi:uncharacterized membrane protein